MRLNNSQLTRALAQLTSANNRAFRARDKIMLHCEDVYGVTPGDVDNDEFVDSVDGGCGTGEGMTADEFHDSMIRSIKNN